ncbi:group III truncated hemoglobin [Sungkyunkwania multivorans]|uniref:Group III truncated hemoglobin n=1 Tax=Sungkyunkwania multivorans TaxID=1173618 RepID=A0ABW3CVP0_9FLAO
MPKKKIENREDVFLLVSSFYKKVRKDALLGPIFNTHINDWDHHLQHLTDFWEGNLFFIKQFEGNPLKKHIEVDQKEGHTIEAQHFGVWLHLWFQTIDELFEGENAYIAKNRARKMGTFFHLNIFQARQQK